MSAKYYENLIFSETLQTSSFMVMVFKDDTFSGNRFRSALNQFLSKNLLQFFVSVNLIIISMDVMNV